MVGYEEDTHLLLNNSRGNESCEERKAKERWKMQKRGIVTRFVLRGVWLEMVSFPKYLLSEDLHRPAVEQSVRTSNKAASEFRWQRLLGCGLLCSRYSGCGKRTEDRDLRSSGVYLSSEYAGKLQGAAQSGQLRLCPRRMCCADGGEVKRSVRRQRHCFKQKMYSLD